MAVPAAIYANMPGRMSATRQDGCTDQVMMPPYGMVLTPFVWRRWQRHFGMTATPPAINGDYGGLGNDAYYLNNVSSVVNEQAGQGVDIGVQHGVGGADNSFAGAPLISGEVENPTLTNGPVNLKGGGNALNNLITGNVPPISCRGSVGADTLQGGGGNDVLYGNLPRCHDAAQGLAVRRRWRRHPVR